MNTSNLATAFTILTLFSGSGGLTKGFIDAGFTSVGSLDYDPRACVDLQRLCGTAAIEADIGAMGPADLLAAVPVCPDVAASSSPCVGYSGCLPEVTSKTQKYQDFNSLALHGIQLLLEAWKGAKTGRKVPGLIVFENVPRIMTRGKKLLEHIVGLLHAEGYAVDMRTHDCGELGRGVAQRRRRFLLVARHMPTVLDFLRKPPHYKPLAIREVLWQLAPPRPGGPDHMHRLPSLSALNWLRLACIPAGGDWRDLPEAVYLYNCDSHELEEVTGIRWSHCAGRHAGKLGVLDWELPSKTVIGRARVCNTWASVADPRVAWSLDQHGGRPDSYGVARASKPSPTVRGKQLIQNTAASTDDPRLADHNHAGAYGMADAGKPAGVIRGAARVQNTHVSIDDARVGVDLPPRKNRQNGGRGVEKSSEPAHAVIAEGSVSNTKASVSDARVATSYERGPGAKSGILGVQPAGDPSKTILGAATVRNSPVSAADPRLTCTQRSDAYGVQAGDEPSATIVGNHCHDNVRGSLADARLAVELDHTPRRGTMGVQVAAEPADTVRGNHSVRQAPGAVQDPRVAKGLKARPAALEVHYDARGWPVPTHELVRLEDGRLVLYGPAVDFKTTRPRGDLVFRAPDGTLHRPMTDAELALLMGFPLGFEFCGPSSCSKAKEGDKPRTGRRKRIGNAVPPPTAYAIAMEMKATLVASMAGGFRLSSGDVWVTPYTGAIAA